MRRLLRNTVLDLVQKPLMNVAHWLGEQGHDSASARLYTALAEFEPGPVRGAYLRYRALLQENRFEEALPHLEVVVAAYPDAQTFHDYGTLLQQLTRHEDAVEAFDRSLAIDPDRSDGHSRRAFSLMQLGRWTEADAGLRRALRHDDRNRIAWHDLGMTLAQLERVDEAIDAFRAALRIAADVATAMSLAYVLESRGRLSEAEVVLREALEIDGNNPLVISELASVLLRLERANEAYDFVAAADARIPDHPAIVGPLVYALLSVDQIDAALASAQRLVALSDTAYGHATLAWAYLQNDRPADALTAIQRAAAKAATEAEPTIGRDDLTAAHVAILSVNGRHDAALTLFDGLRGKADGFYERHPDLKGYVEASRNALK